MMVFSDSEAEDPILPAFGEESRGNSPPFDRGRAQSHESRRLEVSPTIRTNRSLTCFLLCRSNGQLQTHSVHEEDEDDS